MSAVLATVYIIYLFLTSYYNEDYILYRFLKSYKAIYDVNFIIARMALSRS